MVSTTSVSASKAFVALSYGFGIVMMLRNSVSTVPVPMVYNDLFMQHMFTVNSFDTNQRNIMKRQHLAVADQVEESEADRRKYTNFKGGDTQFEYIPPKNQREVRIFDFSNVQGERKDEMKRNLTKIIQEKVPVYEDKKKIQDLELALLEKGIWAKCQWVFPLPYPLDNDEQCTQSELKFLLQR